MDRQETLTLLQLQRGAQGTPHDPQTGEVIA